MKDGKKVSQKEYQKIVAEEQAKKAKTSENSSSK